MKHQQITFTITNAPSTIGIDMPMASGVDLWFIANRPANARLPDVDPVDAALQLTGS